MIAKMKFLGLILVGFIIPLADSLGQTTESDNGLSQDQRDRIESMQVAFITKEIDLKPDQAQLFWPLFNERKAKMEELRREWNEDEDPLELSADKAQQLLDEWRQTKEEEWELQKTYLAKFSDILSPNQVLALYRAENKFRRQMLKQIRNRGQLHREQLHRENQMNKRHQEERDNRRQEYRERKN